jgi:hypothetical protein
VLCHFQETNHFQKKCMFQECVVLKMTTKIALNFHSRNERMRRSQDNLHRQQQPAVGELLGRHLDSIFENLGQMREGA